MAIFGKRTETLSVPLPDPLPPPAAAQPARRAANGPANGPAGGPAATVMVEPPPIPRPAPAPPPVADQFELPPQFGSLLETVQAYLVANVNSFSELNDPAEIRRQIEPVLNEAITTANLILSRQVRQQLLDLIIADTLGYGPIQPLLDRDDISEVMVNGPKQIYYEHNGRLLTSPIKFMDDNHVMRVIERIVTPLGRRIDQASPMVDARLPDGSRVNAIIPPLSLVGPVITIRKFKRDPLTVEDLIRFGAFRADLPNFSNAAVRARLNIIVSGGTGSGKTTLLNVLSSFIPEDERIVTIEDAAELQLRQPHVVRLEKRPANIEGKGEVSIRDLVVNSLRMRPDRIIVGEVRSGETLDMLQAMNTGHDGSLTTVHSNSPRDTLSRVETMVLMAGIDLPLRAIRQQVASAVDMIVHVARLRDHSRRIVQCTEVVGMEGDTIVMQDIFKFEQYGFDENGRIIGELRPTGLRPKIDERIVSAGIKLQADIFGLPVVINAR